MAKWHCPICGKEFQADNDFDFLPFCSQRCRMIDLGKWCDGSYGIAVKPDEDEDGQEYDHDLHQ